MFNNFGADNADILLKFALAGYVPTDDEFGGAAALTEALEDAVREIVQAMPATLRDAIQRPDLMLVESRATANQTQVFAKLLPLVLGRTHVWAGNPQQFVSKPVLLNFPWERSGYLAAVNLRGGLSMPTPPGAAVEMAEDKFTVNSLTTGQITLVDPLNRNDQVFISYEVDIENVAFAMPSLADLAVTGAASVLGAKLYPQASSQWPYVQSLSESWTNGLEGLATGEWVPAELRVIQWWKAPEPNKAEGRVGSVRRYRA
jgi:hypothetical protein